ncbi:MAG: FAD-dependent oxidoreductase [Acidobacteriia bacterium]|nr:FAD-dependent oxidoreductase [Terriglobia bacterium]
MLEQAEAEQGGEKRRGLLTFVVAGGGFTGVETAAALNGFVREAARQYPSIREQEIETYVIEPGERLLKELDADLAGYAREKLEQGGVRVICGAKLACAEEDSIELAGGRRIPTRTLVWAAGVKPSPVVEKLDCRRGRQGGIVVDRRCQIEGHERAWAIGDCAEVPEAQGQGTYAPTAQNATREGECVAENIVRVMRGEAQQPFRHRTIGEMALVGRRAGVGSVYGLHFSGAGAWALWRLVYLSKMPGWRQRARILFDWMLDFAFGRPTAAIPPVSADMGFEAPAPAAHP